MENIMITLAGPIGSGKTTLSEILAKEFDSKAFFEPVDDNPVLPLFYEGNKLVEEGKQKTNPYAFLLQIFFLNRRFKMIKQAMQEDNNILDRSIYEDKIFMKMNWEQGHTTDQEWDVYQGLLDNMMEELPYAAKTKHPDLMVMIRVSYKTMIKRINMRGREYEQLETDPSLEEYYKDLIARYDDWMKEYSESPILVIDGDKYDFVENESDKNEVIDLVEKELVKIGNITEEQRIELRNKRLN